jgi:hypothetical protein
VTDPGCDVTKAIPSSTALESLADGVTGVPEIRLNAVPTGAVSSVVNDQAPPGMTVVPVVTTTEYVVPLVNTEFGVNVTVLVVGA